MRAVRLVAVGRPVELHDLPVPTVGPGEALLRVKAAGLCHSDAHYRSGVSPVAPLPRTLGHEVAGIVERAGQGVSRVKPGDRVCVHYVVSCGRCAECRRGHEQFCTSYAMIGKHRDGGWAEFVIVPAGNCVLLPPEIPFEHGAAMMCSSATAFHALRKAGLQAGETAAIFGLGGLGMLAVQLAGALGAQEVFGVDIDEAKLELAADFGAVPVINRGGQAAAEIQRRTGGRGVDVALELIGLPATIRQAVECLAPLGRAVVAGLSDRAVELDPYRDLIGKEAAVIGTNDHLASELPALIDFARRGALDLSRVVTHTIPLDAAAVNAALDGLDAFAPGAIRTVTVP